MNVFKFKRKLKGKNIRLTESLTSSRLDLYKLAITKYGYGNVWTSEGRIVTKINVKYQDVTLGGQGGQI